MDNTEKESNHVSLARQNGANHFAHSAKVDIGSTHDETPIAAQIMETHNYISSNGSLDSVRQRNNMDRQNSTIDAYTLVTKRKLLNQEDFDKQYEAGQRPHRSMKEMASDFKHSFDCSGKCLGKKVMGLFPILQLPKYYNMPSDLISDLIAGLTVGIMHIPQGMAYASLASLPPQYGLYTSLFPAIIYALLGTSRHVSPGTYAVVCLMVGGAVESYNCEAQSDSSGSTLVHSNMTEGNHSSSGESGDGSDVTGCKVSVAVTVTLVGGLFQLLLGILHLGFINIYLSEPLSRGFTTGAAVHVLTSQVKAIFGVPVNSYYGPWKLFYIYTDFFRKIDQTNLAALILSVLCIAVIYCTKEYINPLVKKISSNKGFIPIDFIIIIIGTIASSYLTLEKRYDMNVVGVIPTGIPAPTFPDVKLIPDIIADAIGIAVVSYASAMSLTQLFAKKHNYEYDSNQELIAHGVSNVVCSNLNCFTLGMSLSRSAVCENVGCKSPVTTLISSGVLFMVILFVASYFEQLPRCVLAAIIVVALKGMFKQFADLKRYWNRNKIDFSVWLVTFTAVVLLDVAYGLVVGVVYALLTVIGTTQRPYCTLEGKIEDTEIYKDLEVYSKAREIPGIKIFRFDGSIYFASKQYFIDSIYEKVECNPRRLKVKQSKYERNKLKQHQETSKRSENRHKEIYTIATMDVEGSKATYTLQTDDMQPKPNMHHLIVDSTTIGYLDDSGVQGIIQVCSEYKDIGVIVYLAGCKAGVREMLEKGGFHDTFKKDVMFPTVHDAVMAALRPDVQTPEEVAEV